MRKSPMGKKWALAGVLAVLVLALQCGIGERKIIFGWHRAKTSCIHALFLQNSMNPAVLQ